MTTMQAVSLSGLSQDHHAKQPRTIREIAINIRQHWPKVYYGAEPYLYAMSYLDTITDNYYQDSARSILEYFLANATTWRGEDARRLKAEIKSLLKSKK